MGTKFCLKCGVEWMYEGTQERIGSVCERCSRLVQEREEKLDHKKKRNYRRSIFSYRGIREVWATYTPAEQKKFAHLLSLLRRHDLLGAKLEKYL